jgi:hypothetical protein
MTAQVLNKDGSDVTTNVAPINLTAHTMFEQIDVSLNEKLVTNACNLYPYRAMIETLLNYGRGAKYTWLSGAMYYPDTSTGIDNPDPTGAGTDTMDGNGGLMERFKITKNSAKFDMICRLHFDLAQQNRPIIPNVNIRIKIVRSSPEFVLMSKTGDNNYQLKIHEATLLVRTLELADDVLLSHHRALENGNTCKYPLHRCEVTSYTIAQGVLNHKRAAAVTGQLPVRVVVGIVRNDSLNGDYTLNPLAFSPFSLNYLSVIVNGHVLGGVPLTPRFAEDGGVLGSQYMHSFETLFSATDTFFTRTGNNLGRTDYPQGYTLFAFKLSEDFGDGYFGLKKEGNMQIDMKFAKPTKHTLNVILYIEYLNILEIDKNRTTTFDYTI